MASMDNADIIFLYAMYRRRKLRRRNRQWYIRPVNSSGNINEEYHSLLRDIQNFNDDEIHLRYFRMDRERFADLLSKVGPQIIHRNTHKIPVSAEERLSLTLRILASGKSQQSVADSYRLGKSTVHYAFHETCSAIWEALREQYVPFPSRETWIRNASDFWLYWNFLLCLGAIDGKHVEIKGPPNSGSDFFNYKKYFSVVLMAVVDVRYSSVVLMAVVDVRYKFSVVDVGASGKESDSCVFDQSEFGQRLENGTLDLPDDAFLPGSQEICPYVFVGDESFPLQTHLMRPYPGIGLTRDMSIFNYRIGRARRISENAFGILTARWRILGKPIEANPTNVDGVVKATVALHNYLKSTDSDSVPQVRYVPPMFADYIGEDGILRPGQWRRIARDDGNPRPVGRQGANRASKDVNMIRDRFMAYFLSNHGSVTWQAAVADRTAPHLHEDDNH